MFVKRIVKYFLITTVFIVLFHAVVPHIHHEQMVEGEDSNIHRISDNFVDFLLLGFHINPGNGHFEVFNKNNTNWAFGQKFPKAQYNGKADLFFNAARPLITKDFAQTNNRLSLIAGHLPANALRGPPIGPMLV